MNRFNRGTTSEKPVNSHDASPIEVSEPPVFSAHDAEELKIRLAKAQEKRMRREVEKDQVEKELAACALEAKNQYGVQSIEELEALVAEMAKKDEENMNNFLASLQAEEARLDEIERRLKELDRNA